MRAFPYDYLRCHQCRPFPRCPAAGRGLRQKAVSDTSFDCWENFAEQARRVGAPLYERLSHGVAADESLRAFAGRVRRGQPPANILFAAVHFLLLRGAVHPLRGFYRNLGGMEQGDPFPAFRNFVEAQRDALAPLIAKRITNTNEVARSALLAPAFRALAQEAGEPLHLIEIGPSAGLNLIWDSYAVHYRRDKELFALNAPDTGLILECELRGKALPPLGPAPRVASRIGLERNPVDLADPDQRDWLRALVWPDQVERFERLEKALLLIARQTPEILAGDALEVLPETLAAPPPQEPVCVYHTMVTYQFTEDMREAFEAILILASLRRPVWRLSLEGSPDGENRLTVVAYRSGTRSERQLARCHPHGEWLEWLDSACEIPGP